MKTSRKAKGRARPPIQSEGRDISPYSHQGKLKCINQDDILLSRKTRWMDDISGACAEYFSLESPTAAEDYSPTVVDEQICYRHGEKRWFMYLFILNM